MYFESQNTDAKPGLTSQLKMEDKNIVPLIRKSFKINRRSYNQICHVNVNDSTETPVRRI